jgi:hypothetical protein
MSSSAIQIGAIWRVPDSGPGVEGDRCMKDTDHFLAGVPFTSVVNGSIEEH